MIKISVRNNSRSEIPTDNSVGILQSLINHFNAVESLVLGYSIGQSPLNGYMQIFI